MLLFDSVTATSIPPTAQLIAAYINGNYPSYQSVRARFPKATILTATTNIYADADILDCERGNVTTLSLVPIWLSHFRKPNTQRTVYCSRNTWPAVQAQVNAHQISQPYYWIADWTNHPHLLPGSVATQYLSTSGYDESITDGIWPYNQLSPSLPGKAEITIVSATIGTGIIVVEGNSNGHKFMFTIPVAQRANAAALSILDLSAEAQVKNVAKATSFTS